MRGSLGNLIQVALLTGLLACSATRLQDSGSGGSPAAHEGRGQGGTAAANAGPAGTGADANAGAAGSRAGAADAQAAGGAGDGAAGAAGDPAADAGAGGTSGASAGIDIADVPDAPILALADSCGVIDTTTLHGPCEDAVVQGQVSCRTHVLYDECTFFQLGQADPALASVPTSVCRQRCVVLESSPFWTGGCEPCERTCPEPQQGVRVHAIDVADCSQRPTTPCVTGFGTHQANLDATLGSLIDAEAGWGPIRNGSLHVQLEGGCVSRYYPSGAAHVPETNEAFDALLAELRFDCAAGLTCVQIQGTDTLATP